MIDKHYKQQLGEIKRRKQVKTTDPKYDLVVQPINIEQSKKNVKQMYDSVPRPESAQSIQESKRESLRKAETMNLGYELSLTTQREDAAISRLNRAYKRRLQRKEARHELSKNRDTFDREKYQENLRSNLKKANDALSHYRTRVPNPTPAQQKSIKKATTKTKSIQMLTIPKDTGRPIGRSSLKEEKK